MNAEALRKVTYVRSSARRVVLIKGETPDQVWSGYEVLHQTEKMTGRFFVDDDGAYRLEKGGLKRSPAFQSAD
jgi:hypothetical protein